MEIHTQMSSTVGKRVRTLRESLGLGRNEFCEKTGLAIGTLIGIERDRHEPKVGALASIAAVWPEYAAYLLTDATDTKQRNPEVEQLAQDLKEARKA